MAVTCDGKLEDGSRCGNLNAMPAEATIAGWSTVIDLCQHCADRHLRLLGDLGWHMKSGKVDYKPRAAYIASSGAPFTAEEARAWLVDQGLAKPRGRLSKVQLQAYADAH